jgi:hypothetical protein
MPSTTPMAPPTRRTCLATGIRERENPGSSVASAGPAGFSTSTPALAPLASALAAPCPFASAVPASALASAPFGPPPVSSPGRCGSFDG